MNLPRPHNGAIGAVARFVIGVALAGIGLGIEALLWSNFPPTPFLLVYPAVVVAAWMCGWVGGMAAVLASALALPYWFLPPTDSFAITARRDALDLAIFCVVATLLVGLISRVKRALHEANAARQVAEAATAAKDTVLAIVAHDLRNPLQTIGLSAALLDEVVPEHNERARTIAARIDRSAERAKRLVENILDSARVDATPFPVEMTVSSLSELVDESLSPFEPLADARSIAIDRPPPAALEGTIVCDRDRIVQVLSNLVGNAIKYTPLGGRVSIGVRRAPEGVRFDVRDSGPGMTKEDQKHAFDRLWHGRGPGHGSGLGLWIARSLVEAHGGKIQVSSQPGNGTSLTFVIPQPDSSGVVPTERPYPVAIAARGMAPAGR